MREMEMRWAPAPAMATAARRRGADQPSFSSTLLDAICDSMDEGDRHDPPGPRTAAMAAKKRQEAAMSYYYYKPSLAASYRAARAAPAANGAASPADCSGRGYFSSSEVEYSLRRLRPIRTSSAGGGGGGHLPAAMSRKHQQQKQYQPPDSEKTAARNSKLASVSSARACRRPASPGARLASLLNSIFSGKRRPACSPDHHHHEPACSTAPPSTSYYAAARPCLAKTLPSTAATAARERPSRSRTVRFLDIDGKVAVAAAVAGCRRIPVMEVEADIDGGGEEESSDASSDLFELDNLAAIAPASFAGGRGGSYDDELPVYGTTGVGTHRNIGRRRPYGYALDRSWSRVV